MSTTDPAASRRPNILYFHVDNLGLGELGCYGGGPLRGADTRRIAAFAAEGIRLTHFVVEPQCTPTRSALMTGRYPIRSGNHTIALGGNDGGLVAWERTIGEILSDAGYATACYGKWHIGAEAGRWPTDHGFDEFYGPPRTTTNACGPMTRPTTRSVTAPGTCTRARAGTVSTRGSTSRWTARSRPPATSSTRVARSSSSIGASPPTDRSICTSTTR